MVFLAVAIKCNNALSIKGSVTSGESSTVRIWEVFCDFFSFRNFLYSSFLLLIEFHKSKNNNEFVLTPSPTILIW